MIYNSRQPIIEATRVIEKFGIASDDWEKIENISRLILGFSYSIITMHGSILVGKNNQNKFCLSIQSTLEGKKNCRDCHFSNLRQQNPVYKKAIVFKCHEGLTQFVIPLSDQTALLGPGIQFGTLSQKDYTKVQISSEEEYIATATLIEKILSNTFNNLINKQLSETYRQISVKTDSSKTVSKVNSISNALTNRIHNFSPSIKKRKGRRVVITGVGIISPIGIGKKTFVESMQNGKSGIRRIQIFDPSSFTTQIAGEVSGFRSEDFGMNFKPTNPKGRTVQFAVAASKMAFEDSGLIIKNVDTHRCGVSIGSSSSGMEFAESEHEKFRLKKRVSPLVPIAVFAGATSGEVSVRIGFKGPSLTVSTGCAAATDAIGYATQWIRDDRADIALAGGAEALITPFIMASFCELRVLSVKGNQYPDHASRPFDLKRDGMVISEGAGMVMLEELGHALARKADIYAEVLGYAATGDAHHMTQPEMDGEGAARAMSLALLDAGVDHGEIDYISAHGTSTYTNDISETKAVKTVFGKRADQIPISSIKSMTGHTIGASGGVELVGILLGMKNGFLPPTINYDYPDPECDLDYVPNKARYQQINTVLKNSFAFGGKNACLVVRRYSG